MASGVPLPLRRTRGPARGVRFVQSPCSWSRRMVRGVPWRRPGTARSSSPPRGSPCAGVCICPGDSQPRSWSWLMASLPRSRWCWTDTPRRSRSPGWRSSPSTNQDSDPATAIREAKSTPWVSARAYRSAIDHAVGLSRDRSRPHSTVGRQPELSSCAGRDSPRRASPGAGLPGSGDG